MDAIQIEHREIYINDCIDKAIKYESDVIQGKIIVSKWIKLAVLREQELRKKYNFDIEKVKDVFKFFYYVFLRRKQRFTPLPFQCWIVYCLYSLYRDNGKRLRKYAVIWMARKNAKTTFTAVLSLYELLKGEDQAEVYFLATEKQQASQALKYLKAIIAVSPGLARRIDVLQYYLRFNKHNIAKPLASNADKLDGLNPSFVIIDECHAHPNRDLFNIMDSGMKFRENPLIIEISTAGNRKDYPFFQQLELGKTILQNEDTLDNTFFAFYTLDEEKEIEQPEMWIKSNPALGVTIELDTLIEDCDKHKKTKADYNQFIIKNLNYYQEKINTWIEDEYIKNCASGFDINELRGCKAFIGIDLAATRDLTALAILVEKDGKFYLKVEHFLPDNDNAFVRINGLDLTDWISKGFITKTDKITTDYEAIAQRLSYYNDIFELVYLGYDPWNSSQIIPDISYNLGLPCIKCAQNVMFFNAPLRYIEKLIFEQNIILEKNPVLRWMFRNVIIYSDGNANIKVVKDKSKDSVDGVVAFAMAVGMYLKYINYTI